MSYDRGLIIDNWSALDYKRPFRDARGSPWLAPSWVDEDNHRRLEAYKLLAAYLENASRAYLDEADETKRNERREYGDPQLIVETIVASVLGRDPEIRVDGADEEDDEGNPVDALAATLQEWFDDWADAERPLLTIIEAEEDAVGLGDGVFVISYDAVRGRPTVACYDPGFYFPVLDPASTRDFPVRVHVAWEYEKELVTTGKKQSYVRRITWELVTLTDDGAQRLPWNADATGVTCLMSDGTWLINEMGTRKVDDLDPDKAVYEVNADGDEVRDLDLGIDFIPVVHLPNTVARKAHFGKSSLQYVLQVLDELQAADTDLALTARTVGFPPIGVKGKLAVGSDGKTVTSYGPGTVFEGDVSVVDTSRSLDALLKLTDQLLKRLSANTRLPETTLGRVNPGEVASGFLMSLSFGPLEAMVTKMRLIRDEKYPLLLKMIARLAMQAGLVTPTAELPAVRLEFGRYLPANTAELITQVKELLTARAISTLTAVTMLQQGGLPIDDAQAEVERIEHENAEAAKLIADATGSEDLAAEYLGLELPELAPTTLPPATPPPPELPPPTGNGPVVPTPETV